MGFLSYHFRKQQTAMLTQDSKNMEGTNRYLREIVTGKGDYNVIGITPASKENYSVNANNLNKYQILDADQRAIELINFVSSLTTKQQLDCKDMLYT